MLGNRTFYHQLTRKAVVLFGRIFDDLQIIRRDADDNTEKGRFIVPIVYAPKEKMITRTLSDPDLQRQVQIVLPRMSYELTSISYDSSRKQISTLRAAKSNTVTHVNSMYMGVPYDLTFELNIYARNIDDGTYIVEQILPFFTPDFTVTTNMVPDLGLFKDTPIILKSVQNNIQYEGDFDSVRYVMWTLTFSMKMYYYGPISYPKIIRTVYTRIYNDPSIQAGYVIRINTNQKSANSTFKSEDVVYQGDNYHTATAYGIVNRWNANTGKLLIGAAQGTFRTNARIFAVSTNASANIASFDTSPLLLANIQIQPDPITAGPGDDYGYDITITEWPDTE